MSENETNVAPEGTSTEPAKTADNETIVSSPGARAGGAGELVEETNVSAMFERFLEEVRTICAPFKAQLEETIEAAKAEILAKVSELVAAKSTDEAVPAATAPAPTLEPAAAPASRTGPTRGVMVGEHELPHELAVGDPVKVWADPEHKTFLLGTIFAVHAEGGAFDVETDDGVTKIPADGLEFDDRR